jgi:hypothetical protein
MGGTIVKSRFFLIVAVCVLVLVIVIAAAASSGGSSRTKPPGVYTCTVSTTFGLDTIVIVNQNQNTHITKTAASLPYSFNFTVGDTLQFNATVLKEYTWNAWMFVKTGTFSDHNPLVIKPDKDIVLMADCLFKTSN